MAMAIARGRRTPPRLEDMEQEALLDQMADSPYNTGGATSGGATGGDNPYKVPTTTPRPSGPAASTPGEPGPSVAAPGAPTTSGSAPSMPDAMSGGALARYGTGDIPGAENLASGDAGTLLGFNTGGWGSGERGTNSIKNSFGKIASRYAARPSSLQQVVNDPDFKKLFPEAKIVPGGAGDKIDFGDGLPVDVLVASDPTSDSAKGWAWQTGGGAASATGAMTPLGGGAAVGGPAPPGSPDEEGLIQKILAELSQSTTSGTLNTSAGAAPSASPVKSLMAELQAAQAGQQSPMDMEALLALLAQGGAP